MYLTHRAMWAGVCVLIGYCVSSKKKHSRSRSRDRKRSRSRDRKKSRSRERKRSRDRRRSRTREHHRSKSRERGGRYREHHKQSVPQYCRLYCNTEDYTTVPQVILQYCRLSVSLFLTCLSLCPAVGGRGVRVLSGRGRVQSGESSL